jgi:hypothetical protein
MSNEQKPAELGKLEDTSLVQWEPKLTNRFLVYIVNAKTNKLVVDKRLVRKINRPSYSLLIDGKRHWHTLSIEIYDPIIPTNILFKLLQPTYLNIQINELGPVGDVICTWVIPNCQFKHVEASPLNWSSSDISVIRADIKWKMIRVKENEEDCITIINED